MAVPRALRSLLPGRLLSALAGLAGPFLIRSAPLAAAPLPAAPLLLAALLLLVLALALVLTSAAAQLFLSLAPPGLREMLSDLPALLHGLWRPPAGAFLPAPGALLLLTGLAGALVFVHQRHSLVEGRWRAWLLLGAILLLILLINAINVLISALFRGIDNSLVAYARTGFQRGLLLYGLCLALALPLRALQRWSIPRLALLWRSWLSRDLLRRWLAGRAYYRLDMPGDPAAGRIDNPDQRISQDADQVTATSLSLTTEALEALVTCVVFIVVLCTISGALALVLLLYATGSTLLISLLARRLERLNRHQLRLEADFRYGLVHIRDNAESIAFYRGEGREAREGERRLGAAIRNADRLILWEALLTVLRDSYGSFSEFLPWMVLAPLFFAHRVEYGVFGQASLAYAQVLASLSYVVDNVDRLAAIAASIRRLDDFQARLSALTGLPVVSASASMAPLSGSGGVSTSCGIGTPEPTVTASTTTSTITAHGAIPIASPSGASPLLSVRHADLRPPGAEHGLIQDLSLVLEPGERLLVVGPSGCGKTSLLRLLGGLWPAAAGVIQAPPPGALMLIPQKPYLPLGSLRQQLCYPRADEAGSTAVGDPQLRSLLEVVRLSQLLERYPDLAVRRDWSRVLSLGEQQRLAFARLLLQAPRLALLDEATSALDLATEAALYEALIQSGMALVSVAHRPSLQRFHHRVLALDGRGGWRID